jgi:hypothetical protein
MEINKSNKFKVMIQHRAKTFSEFSINERVIVPRDEMDKKIKIDLSGPQGNAFYLIGLARKLYRQLHQGRIESSNKLRRLSRAQGENMDDEDSIKSAEQNLVDEMMSGDYEHLIEVFDREFGDFVILYK